MAAPESIRQNGMKQHQQVIPFWEEQRKKISRPSCRKDQAWQLCFAIIS
jgi:hypothetical protein